MFFNGKARLHVRRVKDGKSDWDSKGLGVLTVRQRKDGTDGSTYVTFTNDGVSVINVINKLKQLRKWYIMHCCLRPDANVGIFLRPSCELVSARCCPSYSSDGGCSYISAAVMLYDGAEWSYADASIGETAGVFEVAEDH